MEPIRNNYLFAFFSEEASIKILAKCTTAKEIARLSCVSFNLKKQLDPVNEIHKEFAEIKAWACNSYIDEAYDSMKVSNKFMDIGRVAEAVFVAKGMSNSCCYGLLAEKGASFSYIIEALLKTFQYEEAFKIADSLEGGFYDDDCLRQVSFVFLRYELKEKALFLANKMTNKNDRDRLIARISNPENKQVTLYEVIKELRHDMFGQQ